MAIKYYSGFETDSTILAADGLVLTGATVSSAQRHRTLSGRGGDRSILMSSGSQTLRIPAFTAGVAEEVHFAIRHDTGSSWILTFLNNAGSENVSLRKAADGFLRIHRTAGTVLATSAAVLVADTWNWLRMVVTAREAASAGRVQVYVGGSLFVDTGAGVDCRQTATDDFASVEFTGANTFNLYVDDFVQGTLPDGRARYVQLIRPTSETATIDGTPSTGTDNALTVDEDPVSTTDYNELVSAGAEDRLNMSNLGFTPLSVDAVRPMALMTGEGSIAQGRTLVESGGSSTYGTNRALSTGGTYAVVGDVIALDPNGSIAWTGTSVDALISGYEANT